MRHKNNNKREHSGALGEKTRRKGRKRCRRKPGNDFKKDAEKKTEVQRGNQKRQMYKIRGRREKNGT